MKLRTATAKPWQQPGAPPGTVEAKAPARAASFISDLFVPMLQAAVTGAAVAGLVAFIVHKRAPDWTGTSDLWLFLTMTVATITWLGLLVDTRKLLWAVERVLGVDLDHDHDIGEPKERIVRVGTIAANLDNWRRQTRADASHFYNFVAGLDVHGTDQRYWEKELAGIDPEHTGREKLAEYRDTLFQFGWAHWKHVNRKGQPNRRGGWELTNEVDYILQRING